MYVPDRASLVRSVRSILWLEELFEMRVMSQYLNSIKLGALVAKLSARNGQFVVRVDN